MNFKTTQMKNNRSKYYIALAYLCSTFMAFAQPGTDDEAGGSGLEDADPLPIDQYIWVLVALGLVFAFLRFRAVSQQRSLKK